MKRGFLLRPARPLAKPKGIDETLAAAEVERSSQGERSGSCGDSVPGESGEGLCLPADSTPRQPPPMMKRGFLLGAAPSQAKPPAAKANKGTNVSKDETPTAVEAGRRQREVSGSCGVRGERGEGSWAGTGTTAPRPPPMVGDGGQPDWSAVPGPPLAAIARRLPILNDFFSFRGVCVSWRSAGRDAEGAIMASHPPLLFAHPFMGRFYHPAEKRFYENNSVEFFREEGQVHVLGFSHGHFVRMCGDKMWLSNPLTGAENHCFPRRDYPFHVALLSSPPTSPGCVLLAYDLCNIEYCRPGGKEWRVVYRAREGEPLVFSAAMVGEKGYALLDPRGLVGFDLTENPKLTTLNADRDVRPTLDMLPTKRSHSSVYLAESRGELFAFSSRDFVVFRFNPANCRWVKSEDLRGRAVFVDRWREAVFVDNYAKWGGNKDCIYFFDRDRRQVMEYKMKDGTSKPFLFRRKNLAMDKFVGVWVLPSLS